MDMDNIVTEETRQAYNEVRTKLIKKWIDEGVDPLKVAFYATIVVEAITQALTIVKVRDEELADSLKFNMELHTELEKHPEVQKCKERFRNLIKEQQKEVQKVIGLPTIVTDKVGQC